MDCGQVVYVGPNVTSSVCRLSIGFLELQYTIHTIKVFQKTFAEIIKISH